MQKTILTFLAACAATALAVVSCSEKETEITTYENDYEQTLAQDDSISVKISHSIEYYKSFKGGSSLCKKINNTIVKACFGDQYDGFTIEEASDVVSDTLMAVYQRDAGQNYDEYVAYQKSIGSSYGNIPATFCNWSYSVAGWFGNGYQDFLTYQVLSESYLGGAHGMYYSIPCIIDLRTGGRVTENDLFLPGYVAHVTELIKASLRKDWESDGSFEGMMQDYMVPNGKCGVSEDGVTWYYQPYEIASYAQGLIAATVSWKDLEPYLNPEYIKL